MYTEFLQRVRRRNNGLYRLLLQVFRPGVVVDAVEREVILQLEIAVGAETSLSWVCHFYIGIVVNARLQERELIVITSVQGKIVDLTAVDQPSNIRRLGLQSLRG